MKCKNKDCNNMTKGTGKTGLCRSCVKIGKKRGPMSEEWKENISKSKKGKSSGMKDKTHTKKTRLKMSKSRKELLKNPKEREKISKAMKIAMNRPEVKVKISGKNSYNYIHGQSSFPYSPKFTPTLKQEIHKRDNFKCQCCGMTQEQHLEKYNKNIEIHHIDYCTFNCDKNNLITLCHKCNIIANANRDYWYAFYTYIMEKVK